MRQSLQCLVAFSLLLVAACNPKPTEKKTANSEKKLTDKGQGGDADTIKTYGGSYLNSSLGEYCIEEFSANGNVAKNLCKENPDCKWLDECPTQNLVKGCPTKSSKQVLWHYDTKEIQACSEKIVKNRKEAAAYFGIAVTADQDPSDIFSQYVSLTLTEDYKSEVIVSAESVDVAFKKGSQHLVTDFSSGKYAVPYVTDSGIYDAEIDQSAVTVSGTFKKMQATTLAMKATDLFKDKGLKNKACTLAKYESLPNDTALVLTSSVYKLESNNFAKACASQLLYADPKFFAKVSRK